MGCLRRSAARRRFVLEQLEHRDLLAAVPILHSLPEADTKIFLDFDGHLVEGTNWNKEFDVIHAPRFDVDGIPFQAGEPSFNQDEIDRMTSIWEPMAENCRRSEGGSGCRSLGSPLDRIRFDWNSGSQDEPKNRP